jgi:undecaprenyl-phosphate 4-deoxy-4-formamido-L-arabinose transferase
VSQSFPAGTSVVVPVYNSEATLDELVHRIIAVLREVDTPFEIILVNDGSRDGSWQEISRLASSTHQVRGLNFHRNYGQHNALLAGIRAARFDTTVTLDDDLQNPPEEIFKLLARLREGFDVVYGVPHVQQHGILRNAASTITKLALQDSMGVEIARSISAFRALRTTVRTAFDPYQGPYPSIDVLLTWGTQRFGNVKVRHDPRKVGESHYTLGMLLRHTLNMITGFSTRPLRLASLVGLSVTFLGLALLTFVIGRFAIEGGSVPGFPLLACALAIFSGAQLFCLGIIGEYLARVHFRTMDKPPYSIRENVGGTEQL